MTSVAVLPQTRNHSLTGRKPKDKPTHFEGHSVKTPSQYSSELSRPSEIKQRLQLSQPRGAQGDVTAKSWTGSWNSKGTFGKNECCLHTWWTVVNSNVPGWRLVVTQAPLIWRALTIGGARLDGNSLSLELFCNLNCSKVKCCLKKKKANQNRKSELCPKLRRQRCRTPD